ncbi:MAG: response regulator [Chitinophagales bacterium]|nr:response regulator [Chitinophagales bacterium]
MFGKSTQFFVFIIFLLAFGVLVFLNYKSYTSTKYLIENNDELVEELELSSNIQFFQIHLVLMDNALSRVINDRSKESIDEIEREVKIIKLSSNYLQAMYYQHKQEAIYQEFDRYLSKKLDLCQRIIDAFKKQDKISPNIITEIKASAEWNDIINDQLYQLEEITEKKVREKSEEIKTTERNTQRLNVILIVISTLLITLALIYIFNKIKRQQVLITELEQAKMKEIKLHKIKDDFIANMSHEIRTPLNVILGFTSLMEREKLTARLSEMVQTLKNAGGQLMFIVNQVLDVAKMEEGRLELNAKPFQLKQLVHILDSSYRKMIEDKGIQLEIQSNIKQGNTAVGDQVKLIQIGSNLLSNAQKFTAKGTITLQLNLHQEETQYLLEIVVSDTGIGIEASKISTIFDRFEQADNNITRNYGGTGLGLAIVKQLVDIMNGKIELDSKLGMGSRFKVTIPIQIEKNTIIEQTIAPSDYEIIRGTNILVIEDNSLNTKLIQNWLEPPGLNTTYAVSAMEALDILKNQVFDIILLDIQMPGMDGYTCARHIRNELNLKLPIIGMTAHTRKQDILDCYAAGMHAHIAKPIDKSELFYLLSMYSHIQHIHLINHDYLKKLSGDNEAFIQDLKTEFLKQTPIENEKLRKAFFEDNLDLIKATAHTLKTNNGYIGTDEKFIEIFQSIDNLKELPMNYNNYFLVEYLFEKVKGEVE